MTTHTTPTHDEPLPTTATRTKKLMCQGCEQSPALLRVCCWDSLDILRDSNFLCEACAKSLGFAVGARVPKKGWENSSDGHVRG